LAELTPGLRRRLADIERRYADVTRQLAEPDSARDPGKLRELGRELSALEPVAETTRELHAIEAEIREARDILADAGGGTRVATDGELRELAREQLASGEKRLEALYQRLREQLVPRDPLDEKNVIVEIRGGEGGEEAALFAADLFRMYVRYAERKRWRWEMLSQSPSGQGGFKEVIFRIAGRGAYSRLKFESGVHRVQRVPATEAQGRIHTSTATVAVLPEAEEVDVHIADEDLKIDVFRASGHGGQGVNTTDSAVRVTHLPTGLVVICQDERSQLKNKAKAVAVLRARLLDLKIAKREQEEGAARRAQIGRGERAEKIRTYNFAQDRITDKRLDANLSGIERRLDGDIDDLIDALSTQDEAERLTQLEDSPA
jgi:peptide chain release factor 1